MGIAVALKVSVIIPCNNRHDELLETVKAVCNQTVKPSEIIIVDSSIYREVFPVEID